MAEILSRRVLTFSVLTAGLLALGALSGCEQPTPSWLGWTVAPPAPAEQVHAATPQVSYNFRGEQGALEASRKAGTYCGQYQSSARPLHTYSEIDGTSTAEFECVPGGGVALAPLRPTPPAATFSYRTDEELQDLSRSAQSRCAAVTMPMTSTVKTDGDGNRTVTFQCGRG